jgi:hypothetical protein
MIIDSHAHVMLPPERIQLMWKLKLIERFFLALWY